MTAESSQFQICIYNVGRECRYKPKEGEELPSGANVSEFSGTIWCRFYASKASLCNRAEVVKNLKEQEIAQAKLGII